jgi:hypothetical protein
MTVNYYKISELVTMQPKKTNFSGKLLVHELVNREQHEERGNEGKVACLVA